MTLSSDHEGGLLIIRCVPHGQVCFTSIVKTDEGRNDYFSAVYCHWQSMPSFFLGDFSCGLCPYSVAREPHMFRDTVFMNDGWHGRTHKCGVAYLFSHMKNLNKKYHRVNDQKIEQGNRVLSLLSTSASWLSKAKYMLFVQLVLEIDNRRIRRLTNGIKPGAEHSWALAHNACDCCERGNTGNI